jgi:peptide chain release factor 1
MAQNQKSHKEVILSLSKKKGDFIVTAARSSGPGGQNVNKVNSKIQITHLASGATGMSQTFRTQEKNRREAFRRLVDSSKFQTWLRMEIAKRLNTESPREQEGPTGSRGEKVRTYNYSRDEVIDHRTGLKIKGIQKVLDGEIDELIDSVREKETKCLLEEK